MEGELIYGNTEMDLLLIRLALMRVAAIVPCFANTAEWLRRRPACPFPNHLVFAIRSARGN